MLPCYNITFDFLSNSADAETQTPTQYTKCFFFAGGNYEQYKAKEKKNNTNLVTILLKKF